jgi:hypothetical protein
MDLTLTMKECGICEEETGLENKCPKSDIYFCRECILNYIKNENKKNNITGKLYCPCGECNEIVKYENNYDYDIIREYKLFMSKHHEHLRSSNFKEPKTYQEYINYINNYILTQYCPQCKISYSEFDGCTALQCTSCTVSFCAYCGDTYPFDIHEHTPQCHFNILSQGSGYTNREDMKYISSCLIYQKLLRFLFKIKINLAIKLLIYFRKELKSYKIDISDDLSLLKRKLRSIEEIDNYVIDRMKSSLLLKKSNYFEKPLSRFFIERDLYEDLERDQWIPERERFEKFIELVEHERMPERPQIYHLRHRKNNDTKKDIIRKQMQMIGVMSNPNRKTHLYLQTKNQLDKFHTGTGGAGKDDEDSLKTNIFLNKYLKKKQQKITYISMSKLARKIKDKQINANSKTKLRLNITNKIDRMRHHQDGSY